MVVRAVWGADGPLNKYTADCIFIHSQAKKGELLPPGGELAGSVGLFLAELVDVLAGRGNGDTAGQGVGNHVVGHKRVPFWFGGLSFPLLFLL